jgi:GntR family transcriptional repressor for pyruvate dehydrogenase complex
VFDVTKSPLAYESIAERLKHQIISGEIRPDERLPIESQLATAFDVGRSTAREALRTLVSQGLVVTTRGTTGGTFVRHPADDALGRPIEIGIGYLVGAEAISVAELLEARALLEVPAAQLAAERGGEADVEAIIHALYETRASELSSTFESSKNFHVLILKASGNHLLEMMTRPVFSVLRSRFLRDEAPKAFWRKVAQEHADIAAAIEGGHRDAAGEAMQIHLSSLSATYSRIDRLRFSESKDE